MAFATDILLRVYRGSPKALTGTSFRSMDIEAVLARWAMSEQLIAIANRIIEDPRVIREGSSQVSRASEEILGAVDGPSTVMLQFRTGNPLVFVTTDAVGTGNTPQNRLVAWLLHYAFHHLESVLRSAPSMAGHDWAQSRLVLLHEALRNPRIREVLSETGGARPRASDLRQARRTISPFYKNAIEAFDTLGLLEDGDEDAVGAILREYLVLGLADWQCFELGVGLAILHELSSALGEEIEWHGDHLWHGRLGSVGKYDVHWQARISPRPPHVLDESERSVREVLNAIDTSISSGRSDVSIFFGARPLSIVECKWSERPGNASAFKNDAAHQLVRYARDTAHAYGIDSRDLIQRSAIALATSDVKRLSARNVGLFDFESFTNGELALWTRDLIHHTETGAYG